MRLAIYQSKSQPCHIDANLNALEKAAKRAAKKNAHLLITPELFVTGYNIGRSAHVLAQPKDGEIVERVGQIAFKHGISLVFGYPERVEDKVYNSACFVTPKDGMVANYQKMHLYGCDEKELFAPGDQFVSVDCCGLKIGLLICYDVEFPEAVREHALRGVDLVVVPTALWEDQNYITDFVVRTRALENHVFLAYVNHCGRREGLRYCGNSSVVSPMGKFMVRAGTNRTVEYADLNPSRYRKSCKDLPYLDDRRPELYRN